jgi:hypothetical protein
MGCNNSASDTKMLYGTANRYTSMPIHNWYLIKYGEIANSYNSNSRVKIDEFLKKYEKNILYKDMYFSKDRGESTLYAAIIDMDSKGTIAYVEECHFDSKESFRKATLNILYSKETTALAYAKKYISKNIVREDKKGIINLICKSQQGFELKEFSIKDPNIDFESNYNEDFKSIDSIILEKLNQEDGKGLVMLYGEPGTGKTSYIRRIINHVNKRVLYLPPDMATELSNPGLVPFLIDIPNSILIVEDAENVLIKRQGQHNQAISNILNLSDGLFGDCLNIQILATFNTSLSNIDEALLRKGRLIAKYEFKKLSGDRVKRLSKKLGIKYDKSSGTLAEIYNCEDTDFSSGRAKIGFPVSDDNGLINNKERVTAKKVKVPSRVKHIVNTGVISKGGFN